MLNYQTPGGVAMFEGFWGRDRSSSCVSPCVGYSLDYAVVFWVMENNEMEPACPPPPPYFLCLCKRSCRTTG